MRTTLGKLRTTYCEVHREFNMKAFELSVERNRVKDAISNTENGQEVFGERAATLDIQYNAIREKLDEYNDFIAQYMEMWEAEFSQVEAEENEKASEDYYRDLAKVMTVIRRMCKGDTVPGQDEQKVKEYNDKVYMAAKSAQAMQQALKRKHKEYDSLWEDEEEREYRDPFEEADNVEVETNAPEIMSTGDVIAEATGE